MSILNELKFPKIIFGANVFGWTLDEKQSFKMLDELYELGYCGIDTANMYSTWVPGNKGGESERIIGKWMKERGNREHIRLITKVGMEVEGKSGLSKDYILNAIDESLSRLQTDYVDVYLAHQEDTATPIEESLEAFTHIKKSGRALAVGASNYSLIGLKESMRMAQETKLDSFQVYQPEYNLYNRESFEAGYAEFCKENHIDVITYFSLARGFLTGKYRSKEDANKSQRGSRIVANYLNEKGFKLLEAMDQVAKEKNAKLSTVAIAWLLHQNSVYAPIVSATSSEQLREVLSASRLKLTADDLNHLDI
ncbi:MAG: aldo/keto reductase [Bdellovibrionota bacterium]|nr:aldo/keto reductase [Bdellovibrionota bacterium]